MRERQKILALVLAVLVLTVLAVILWLPSRSVKGSVDFGIRDENSNFHYEDQKRPQENPALSSQRTRK